MNSRRGILCLLCLLLFLCSCDQNVTPKPDVLLSEKELAEVLLEINSIEVAYENRLFSKSEALRGLDKDDFYASLYKKYDINKTILEQNIVYYSENNKKFVDAYELAIEKAEEQFGKDTLEAHIQTLQEL